MKIIPYNFRSSSIYCSDAPLEFEVTDQTINQFISAANKVFQILYPASLVETSSLTHFWDPDYCKLLRHVSIHSFSIDDTIFIPFPNFSFTYELTSDYNNDLLVERFEIASKADFTQSPLESSGYAAFEHPEYILFLLEDYPPWPGIEEGLYAGFFKKGCEKWNIYYASRNEFPSDQAISSVQGIIINGAKYGANDDLPWLINLGSLLLRLSIERPSVKIIGICLSHQLIGKVFGGQAGKNPDQAFFYAVENIKATKTNLFLPENICITQCHGDCVSILPRDAEVLYTSSDCAVEMMRVGNNILTVQGHPEFTSHFLRNFHAEAFYRLGELSKNEYENAKKSANERKSDSEIVIKAFNDFLRNKINFE